MHHGAPVPDPVLRIHRRARGHRLAVALVLVLGLQPGHSPAEPDGKRGPSDGCPAATCGAYVLLTACPSAPGGPFCRHPLERDGFRHLRFWVNPARVGIGDSSSVDELVAQIRYAARTWEYANPTVRLDFMGFTDRLPLPYDGFNVVAFTDTQHFGQASVQSTTEGVEVDIQLGLHTRWRVSPCRWSCPAVPLDGPLEAAPGVLPRADLGSTITHELGHALGFDHPVVRGCMTMGDSHFCPDAHGTPPGMEDRFQSSLSRAELLGMKVLYPYTCPPTPRGYREPASWTAAQRIKARTWLPWRYRQVCPTFAIGNP